MVNVEMIIQSAVGLILGSIAWLLRSNIKQINTIKIDIALIKQTIESVKEDHEKLIELKHRVDKHDYDLNNTNNKLRRIANDE